MYKIEISVENDLPFFLFTSFETRKEAELYITKNSLEKYNAVIVSFQEEEKVGFYSREI